jgi:tRNA-splicing endonuclease subunit Sen2
MRALWEQGFYGKGNLSRSEPNWLRREQVRRGLREGHVSEIFTVQRREERTRAKWERARLEQEMIRETREQELLRAGKANVDKVTSQPVVYPAPVGPMELLKLPNSLGGLPVNNLVCRNGHGPEREETNGAVTSPGQSAPRAIPGLHLLTEQLNAQRSQPLKPPYSTPPVKSGNPAATVTTTEITNKEHLQLMPEEALWLSFGMGALAVTDPELGQALSSQELLRLCRQHSFFPPRVSPDDPDLQPDDPFLVHYAVYHHFRSLGWVPRAGIKFGVDWLLYAKGPVFDHAEFGLVVVPAYSHAWWKCNSDREARGAQNKKTWAWLHSVVRVLSHVFKSLVLVYVDVPSPPELDEALEKHGIAGALQLYKVRDFPVKRWSPNRNR